MIELLEIEHECILRNSDNNCDRKCANCDLVQDDKELHEMYMGVITLLKEQKAEWIYGEDETGADGWHCSYCGFFEPWFYKFTDDIDFIRFYSFCPSCGRRMASYTGKPTQEDGEME
jgi:hypothetical protein